MITKKPNESRVESNIEPRAKGCLLGLMNDDRLKARHGIELRRLIRCLGLTRKGDDSEQEVR